jgi:hypothetical protein
MPAIYMKAGNFEKTGVKATRKDNTVGESPEGFK